MLLPDSRETFRFAEFELDVATYELRRRGRPIRLERQPMDVLTLLVQRRGVLVSHAEIIHLLWGKDVFVDVETGIHTAIRKIRQALRDSREQPVYVETVSGKGYRFIAAVEVVPAAARSPSRATAEGPGHVPSGEPTNSVSVPTPAELKSEGESPRTPAASGLKTSTTVFTKSTLRLRVAGPSP
jgi:DNA-binding winged helix-turn-helix (wHTH) protein